MADLAVARERLTRLGFTVAPNGLHPFGTQNCCVYFADGTFLEPLAVADPTKTAQAALQGNVFVARDRSYRTRCGEEGFSALVFGTDDADTDHRQFVERGVSAGDPLSFSRPFTDASGKADVASFKLAFAADPGAPDVFFFTCERVNAPAVDRSALQRHRNGVVRIKAVLLATPNPEKFARLLGEAVGTSGSEARDGLRFSALNGDVVMASHSQTTSLHDGMLLSTIVFGVGSVPDLSPILSDAGVDYLSENGAVIVPAAPGQGARFIFEELQ